MRCYYLFLFLIFNNYYIFCLREEQNLFSLLTVKRKEAGENECFQELELHICVVCWTTSFANERRVEF